MEEVCACCGHRRGNHHRFPAIPYMCGRVGCDCPGWVGGGVPQEEDVEITIEEVAAFLDED